MANVKWIKITTDIFDDEAIQLIEQMPEGDSIIVIWFKLLIKAGQINNGGLIYFRENIPYTEEMLATILRKPISTVRLAIQTFVNFGMIEITDQEQLLISNWEKHQNIERLEEIKKQTNERVRRHRERQKLKLLDSNVTVTLQETLRNGEVTHLDIDKEIDIDKDINKYIYIKDDFLKIFLKEYEKVFINVPILTNSMKDKIIEIMSNNPNIKDRLGKIFQELKDTKFEFKNGTVKPDLTWLLKENNFCKIANGGLKVLKKDNNKNKNFDKSKYVEEIMKGLNSG